MSKFDFKKMVKSVQVFTKKNSPAILTGIGVAGLISTTLLSIEATKKAVRLVDEKMVEESKESITKKEVIATTWKCYIPTAVSMGLSAACILSAHKEHGKRNAALATAYQLSQSAFADYKEQVIASVGEAEAKMIDHKVVAKKVNEHPVNSEKATVIFDSKDSICYDVKHDRYFKADREKLRAAENDINFRMLSDNYISENEIYDILDINHVSSGDVVGFSIFDGKLEFILGTQITPDGRAALTLEFSREPKANFNTFS